MSCGWITTGEIKHKDPRNFALIRLGLEGCPSTPYVEAGVHLLEGIANSRSSRSKITFKERFWMSRAMIPQN